MHSITHVAAFRNALTRHTEQCTLRCSIFALFSIISLIIGRFLTLMGQFIEDEGISEERGWYAWLSCVKNRAKFKMPYSPICDAGSSELLMMDELIELAMREEKRIH